MPENKDPKYAEKLEEKAKTMFGRAFRFLNKDQKREVTESTPFEPIKAPEPAPAPKEEPRAEKEPEAKAPKVVLEPVKKAKMPVPDGEHIALFECADGHYTKGTTLEAPLGCRVCNKPDLKMKKFYIGETSIAVDQ